MITGAIKTHEEPEKVKTYRSNQHWEWMCEDLGGNESYSVEHWKTKENELLATLNAGTIKGLTMNARVKRASGNPGEGTIVHIHRTHTMAWNHMNRQLEPFKVVWDKTTPNNGGTFDYSVDDILPLEAKQTPVLFIMPKKEQQIETLPGAC